ncbi:unnamed protein product [Urochloa decumbens]|uniref:DUF1618 domain-containing protein n=1 Tax=Urochloa decumbens TaxID=240449 RepID=A0ABC9BLU0_9POAL
MPEPEPPHPAKAPSMVLVERCVVLVDELEETIEEIGGLSLDRYIESAIRGTSERGAIQNEAFDEAVARRRKVEEDAFAILRKRKASRTPAVRKEPLPEAACAFFDIYSELLDAIELSSVAAADAPPTVTRLSLKVSRPPRHLVSGYPSAAFVAGGHRCFLVLYVDGYRPGTRKPGFYLVYNAWANSVAVVPPHFGVDETSHCDIGAGAVLLCCGEEPDYILAELLLRRKEGHLLPTTTNKATLFIWGSSTGQWVQSEVLLPLPTTPASAAAAQDDDEEQAGTATVTFRADMAFAVSFSSICWVDLLTGILVYNHIHSGKFHFIPLPEECVTGSVPRGVHGQRPPEEYRSMCCIDRQTLKFVSMDRSYNQECPMLTTWTLRWPLSPANWKWHKDPVSSFSMQDLWEDPVYKAKLKLEPLLPTCPVISTQEPGTIYISVNDCIHYKHSHVLSLDMGRCRVEGAYEVPADDENGIVPHPRIFTSDFSSYLNKTREWEMKHGRRDDLYEGPLADEEEPRSNPSPYTVGVGLIAATLKLTRGAGLGAGRVIPTPSTALGPTSRRTGPLASSLFCPVGLQAALDNAIG